MSAKKAIQKKAATPARTSPNAFEVKVGKETASQALAKLATSSVLAATAIKSYSNIGDDMELIDLVEEMILAGDEVNAGDMGRVERMLVTQLLTLDTIFQNMAQRSFRQETFKGIEVLMRLGLKAQAQARSTAEALALLKNPMPYIKQANMTTGPQQVNNSYAGTSSHKGIQSGAENFQNEPNKLLEADHGQRLDTGAQAAAGRANQKLEAVG